MKQIKQNFFGRWGSDFKNAALSSFCFYNPYVSQNLSDEELEALEKLSENNNLVVQKVGKGNAWS